jgi:uncharacterized membrane protein YhaH (DUF805 family)
VYKKGGKMMIEAYKKYWVNIFNFSGRTTRRDYWLTILMNFIIAFVVGFILGLCGIDTTVKLNLNPISLQVNGVGGYIVFAWSLINLIPGMAMLVRRLHDGNHSGLLVVLEFIPIVNIIAIIIIFIFTLMGSVDTNKYGSVT